MTTREPCDQNRSFYCYVCGNYAPPRSRTPFNSLYQQRYTKAFGTPPVHMTEPWVAASLCGRCRRQLLFAEQGKPVPCHIRPQLWRPPDDHSRDCYLCGIVRSPNSQCTLYPNAPYVCPDLAAENTNTQDTDHGEEPQPNKRRSRLESQGHVLRDVLDVTSEDEDDVQDDAQDADYVPRTNREKRQLRPMSQDHFNRLSATFHLSKAHCESLASNLRRDGLAGPSLRVTSSRTRSLPFVDLFNTSDGVTFCHDVSRLMQAVGFRTYKAHEWRLFIDSSQSSLKVVLLHEQPSTQPVLVAYSVERGESYATLAFILDRVRYQDHMWQVCADFKVIGILAGLQAGYTTYPCHLCLWNSRMKSQHYVQREWDARPPAVVGEFNVKDQPLVSADRFLLPPLHVKLGLARSLVKTLAMEMVVFDEFKRIIKRISNAKLLNGILTGPEIRTLVAQKDKFYHLLNREQVAAFDAFIDICDNFLGNHRAPEADASVRNLLHAYHDLSINMSTKMHMLHSHLAMFPTNCGQLSDEHGERFHQTLAPFERRYRGQPCVRMIADYSWFCSIMSQERTSGSPLYRMRSLPARLYSSP